MTAKRVMVTGAGGGIGRATCLELTANGVELAVVDRRLELADAVAEECRALGGRARGFAMDQRSREDVVESVRGAIDFLGGIDGLFANAGFGQFAGFLDTSDENWSKHVDVNLHGTFNVAQVVASRMVEQRSGGAIVLNASSGGSTYSARLFAYCVTKAAIVMAAKGMAAELGVHRIRVNAILPGVIETPMTESQLGQGHRDVMIAETPMGRLGVPGDVASTVSFLLADDSSYISGATIAIDGGQTLHGYPRWFRTDSTTPFLENWVPPS